MPVHRDNFLNWTNSKCFPTWRSSSWSSFLFLQFWAATWVHQAMVYCHVTWDRIPSAKTSFESRPCSCHDVGYPSAGAAAHQWTGAFAKSPASKPCQYHNIHKRKQFANNLELVHPGGDDLLLVGGGQAEIRGKSVVPEQGSWLFPGMREGPLFFKLLTFVACSLTSTTKSRHLWETKKGLYLILVGPQIIPYIMGGKTQGMMRGKHWIECITCWACGWERARPRWRDFQILNYRRRRNNVEPWWQMWEELWLGSASETLLEERCHSGNEFLTPLLLFYTALWPISERWGCKPMLKGSLGGKQGSSWNRRLETLKTSFSLICFGFWRTDHEREAKRVAVDGSRVRDGEDGFGWEGKWWQQRLSQGQPWGEHQGCAGGGWTSIISHFQ